MKIYILGAGSIGSTIGALLSKTNEVILIGNRKHAAQINQSGLELKNYLVGNFQIPAQEEITQLGSSDIIILTTKVMAGIKAIDKIRNLITPGNTILCLQNGIGIEEPIKRLTNCPVYRLITDFAACLLQPGVVACNYIGKLKCEAGTPINIFRDINSAIYENIQHEAWKKNILNCMLNPLTAIYNIPNSDVVKLEIRKDLIREVKHTLDAEGILFPPFYYEYILDLQYAQNISSMLRDVRRGKETEIDFINGAVVQLARKHGVSTPTNDMVIREVKCLSSNQPS